ncbi:putative DD41D transposase [Trichonephila clavipes]|nr:putative DD41D transposase [Trichonephila clavipes]
MMNAEEKSNICDRLFCFNAPHSTLVHRIFHSFSRSHRNTLQFFAPPNLLHPRHVPSVPRRKSGPGAAFRLNFCEYQDIERLMPNTTTKLVHDLIDVGQIVQQWSTKTITKTFRIIAVALQSYGNPNGVKVTESWLACHKFKPSTAEDQPCRESDARSICRTSKVFPSTHARRRFVEWAQNEIALVPDFHKRILFSDEAHFWLNSFVKKQNCHIWSEANPQVCVETPLHPEKLTVWCALWAGGIIGPDFFKNDEGHNGTVNGDRYRAMITNFFIPELNNHDVQELWFQQDGATCHTARVTIDLLKDTFGDRLISRFGPVNFPPESCDLTPLDYFLGSYVKSLVYADKPQTLDHLEDNIRRVIADIRPQMLEKVIENWTSRLDYIRASRGCHMPEIIFKM